MKSTLFSGLFVASLALPVQALESDTRQPIKVEADRVEIDDNSNVSIYRGNVILVQGSIRLESDTLKVTSTSKGEKLEASGDPVKFRQQPDNDDGDILGESQELEYLTDTGIVVLTKKASLKQARNTFNSDRIRYDANKAVVSAGSTGGGRVTSTIQPRSDKE